MARARVGIVAVAVIFAACMGSDLDSLKGGPHGEAGKDANADGTAEQCVQGIDCRGCIGCSKFCACAAPQDVVACVAGCDAGAGSGGTSPSGGGGTSSSGGGGSPADAGGEAGASSCSSSIQGKTCTQVIIMTNACGQCEVTKCCSEFDNCLKDHDCSGLLECLVNTCATATDANVCIQEKCPACAAAQQTIDLFNAMGTCTQANCSAECG